MDAPLFLWNLELRSLRPDIPIPGSPERCIERQAVEDGDGRLWVLERIPPSQIERRTIIARNLERLADQGMQGLAPYRRLPSESGAFVAEHDGHPWQLSPYLAGSPLPQPDYVDDPERGTGLALLLAELSKASHKQTAPARTGQQQALEDTRPGLALPPYIAGLNRTMATRQPGVAARLQTPLAAIAPLMEHYPELSTAFCHGDFHPLNVIWRGSAPVALIDWEFCGFRPRLFDAANLLGCVGIEDPAALANGLAPALVNGLRREGLAETGDLRALPRLVLAQRWAWLSEWLRKNDREMVVLELDYMDLLAARLDDLERIWAA